jgi:hypothetical protein
MSYTTYYTRNVVKFGASMVVSGSDDATSAAAAEWKVGELSAILQVYFQARDMEFNDTEIGIDDCRSAILYARGKKHTKAVRRAAVGTAKLGLQIAAATGAATVGTVVLPVVGTAAGGAAGFLAGASLSPVVTLADRLKRAAKGLYKMANGTRGVHREQAANTLMHCAQNGHRLRDPARLALVVLLGEEYDEVMRTKDVDRLASRMKSN